MKHRFSFAAAIWWVLACLIAGVFLMVTSEKEERISEAENRMLQGFPKLSVKTVLNDEFTTGFDAFLSDSFFGRDNVISFTNGLMDSFSLLSEDDAMVMEASTMDKELQNANLQLEEGVDDLQAESAAADMDMEEADPGEEEIIVVEDGRVPITDEHSYLYFEMTDGSLKKFYTYDKDKIDTYAETLKIMQSYLPVDGQILFTEVPLASIANRWLYQQDEYAGWGCTVELMLEESLGDAERIHVFSTYDILEPYITGDTPMFYHTDHHWSAEGAHLVYSEMMKRLGIPAVPYDEYTYKAITSEKSKGSYHDTFNVLYSLLPVESMVMSNTDVFNEIHLMNYTSTTYRSFMNNTRLPWRKVITGANTGRKALILCDSFGNAFAPYLLPHYDEVHMADFRSGSYSKSAVGGSFGQKIQQYGIDDVYIIASTANGLRTDNSIYWMREYLQ